MDVEALLELVTRWRARAARYESYTKPYDGGGHGMAAQAADMCADELEELLRAPDTPGEGGEDGR